jgi:spore coat polysaccharide biosynthesis protein SpsF
MDGITFIARLNSTRLPEKHLIKVHGVTFAEWMIKRFLNEFKAEIEARNIQLILATADEPGNRRFETVLKSLPVKIFYGSINNIPLRLLQTAQHCNLENIISIDGDDILCSPRAARLTLEELRRSKNENWVKTVGLPLGMNVAGYRKATLETLQDSIGTGKKETGWGRVFESVKSTTIHAGHYESVPDLRFTLDYEEDALFFKAVIELLGNDILVATDQQIVDIVIKNDLARMNKGISEQYWTNFNNQIKNEDS